MDALIVMLPAIAISAAISAAIFAIHAAIEGSEKEQHTNAGPLIKCYNCDPDSCDCM